MRPRLRLCCWRVRRSTFCRTCRSGKKTERCAILCYDEEIPHLLPGGLLPVGARDDLATHAHTLFARLRESDSLHADVVYAHLPPREGLGLALYNRMIRAAAHTVRKV